MCLFLRNRCSHSHEGNVTAMHQLVLLRFWCKRCGVIHAAPQQLSSLPNVRAVLASELRMNGGVQEYEQVRAELLRVLNSRRKKQVPLQVYPANPHKPYCQQEASSSNSLVAGLCPKGDCCDNEQDLEEENLILTTEEGEQGRVPLLIIRPKTSNKVTVRRPTVVCLHSTGVSKETMRPFMEAYASSGYVTVAIDARHHGDRGHAPHAYAEALVAAWETGEEMPFIFDTVWDIIKVMDYLTTRPDIDPAHIGMLGISLGGMNTWFAAAADPRIAVAVALIGVQSFGWAISKEQWHARVATIPYPFQAAAQDFGRETIDTEIVAAVWERIAPGIMDKLDSPHTIPAIAPRPLLICNGKDDPRCPVGGLERVLNKTMEVYASMGVPNHFKFIAEEGIKHAITQTMVEEAMSWFNKFLYTGQNKLVY
ncbi:unnamed protein product [Sphagnum jensenii]|uniref:AB hydrolase-1 domain-containing protein n=1 Tax=Sphagnum jensenii TaxID=128206 RepID=A0ABP1BP40_9BRYO